LAYTLKNQFSIEDLKLIKSYNFLTLKPFIYALNVAQDDLAQAEALKAEFKEKLQAPVAIVCVKVEAEMMEMETEEKVAFLSEMLSLDS
jgi:ribosome-binding ATPase YchF (GTP1/OBG family)